ncbi:MAG: prolipoprotein diacylglyceryl transferase, partial [Nitrospirae bacterium]|nr:prolipoprotein diacylglyceryl transferase [Nitrospirota bacterium]
MIPYPEIKPYIVKIGPLEIRWYGLMYLLGFTASYLLVRYQIKKRPDGIDNTVVDDLYFYLILGLIIGARLGYVVFYNPAQYIRNPLEIFALWHGGMSFHGGLIGTLLAGILFVRRRNLDFWRLSDLIVVTAPVGLCLGRIGNFINGELFGRISNVPWAMVFPEGGPLPRHPSQLYEAILEGPVLFIILWIWKDRFKKSGYPTALFLILYWVFRFFV